MVVATDDLVGMTSVPIRFETMIVTPALASGWLQKADGLHRVNPRAVTNYARAIEQGAWKLNGDPIIFSDRDKLLDGYARLKACVKAGKAFKTLVVWDIKSGGFDTIDSVRKRTLGDILHIRREPNGRQLAAALMIVWRYRNGDLLTQKKQPSAGELLGILDGNPGIRESIRVVADAAPILPLGLGAALHHLFEHLSPDRAKEFFQQFVDGDENSPAKLLNRSLFSMAERKGRRLQPMMLALSIKAWNAFYGGSSIKILKYAQDDEKFPEIVGLEPRNFDETEKNNEQDGLRFASSADASREGGDLSVEVCTVTPAQAGELLKRNDGNRLVAEGVVEKYKRDMIARRWLLNGQTIKVGKTGRLLDGQHRCYAGVKSGIAFPAILVKNVDEDVFDTFDLGGRRSFSDILAQREEKNTAALAAALKWIWLHENGFIFDRVKAPTNAELEDVLERCRELRESVKLANQLRNVIAPGMGVALHYLFSQKDREIGDEFIQRLIDGENINKEFPVWHLREKLLTDRGARKTKLPDGERWVISIKAWNATRQSKKVAALSWRGKGPSREALPEIV